MKNKFITCLLGISLLFSSCENLEPQVFDRLSPNNYPKTAEDARTLVTGGYYILINFSDIGWRYRLMMNTATTDEFVCFWQNPVWEVYSKFLWNANSEHVVTVYGQYIKSISNCVNIIEQLNAVKMDEDLKRRYQAEMKGVIALLSYTLYDFYGPTAIVTDPKVTMDPTSTFQPERPTKEQMVAYIENIAKEAISDLPEKYNSADYGRLTKGAVLMSLLKLYMHEKRWQDVVTVTKQIMDLKVYTLQPSYLSIFAVNNEMNAEIILAVPYMVSNFPQNVWLASVLPSEYVEPNNIPIQKWGGYKVPWPMYDKYEKTDKRLEAIWGSLNTANGVVDLRSVKEPWAQMGAIPYKYSADPGSNGAAHGNDLVIYRYAEVLLSRAEALNYLQPLNNESISLLNEIRKRSSASLVSAADFRSGEELNNYLLDERFRELFLEGSRREDLIRHGKYLAEAKKRGANYTDETRLIFPIPQWAINENPKIRQNKGY